MARRDAEHWTFDDLRQSRGLQSPDLSLGFLRQQFERQIEKPARQLGDLGEVWRELVPGDLVEQTRLESLSRGVLKVAARSAGAHYELDRLLRGGLQRQIIKRMLDAWETKAPGRRQKVFSALMSARPSHLPDTDLFDFAGLTCGEDRENSKD